MHAILATVGTDGDVFPYLGLGAALKSRGHRVTLAAPETYRDRAAALNLEFCSLVTTDDVDRMHADPDLWHPLRSGLMMARWGNPMIPRQYELLAAFAREAECVVVANPGVVAARLVQEKFGVPLVSLVLQPGLIPSNVAPPEMPGGLTIPSWSPKSLRDLYWRGVDGAGYVLVGRALNKFRATLGLRPIYRFFRWWLSPELTIGLFPPRYAEVQPDWPSQFRLAGFGRFDGSNADLPEDVRAFCASGPAPVAFTLGTGMAHAAGFFRNAVAACETLGVRGLLLTRHANQIPARLPASVLHYPYAPFRRLLPLCGAVVHHGGIGTTAAALESGCPQLILPLAWDQPDNAARVVRMGAGLSLGPRQRTAGHLAGALSRLMSTNVRSRCQENAADWIEDLARRHALAKASRTASAVG